AAFFQSDSNTARPATQTSRLALPTAAADKTTAALKEGRIINTRGKWSTTPENYFRDAFRSPNRINQ
ncbi:MAG: hypothetical protein J0M28_17530, partial [Thauera sp.]|nr:hypothetical protein [Thauera sp.]